MPDTRVTSIDRQPDLVLARVETDRLDEAHLAILRSDISSAALASPQLPVIIDMAPVGLMPSLSLGVLVQLSREFRSRQQRLILTGLQPFVRETMAITRIDKLFEIADDVPSATRLVRSTS